MSDFDLEFGVRVGGVDQALRDVGRVEQANQSAARATQTAASATSRAAQQAGQSVQQLGQRAGQAGTALGQMGNVLGAVAGQGSAAGQAFSQLGGAVSALSGAMGPLGVALGAVTLAITAVNTALNYEANQHRAAEQAARDHAEQLRSLASAARQARAALSVNADIAGGSFGNLSSDTLQQQAEERRQRVLEMERGFASGESRGRGLQERVVNGRGAITGRTIEEMMPAEQREEMRRLREEVTTIERELVRREEQAAADQRAAQAESTAAAVRSEEELAARNGRRGGGGGRGGAAGTGFRGDGGAALRGLISDADAGGADAIEFARQLGEEQDNLIAKADERDELEKQRLQDAVERQRELADAARDASQTFAESWRGSIDQVIEAWHDAREAQSSAGEQMLSTSELLRVGMTSVGNEIADTIGGTMKGAFEQALGAWLDGSKSFVEAAEEMARGVLKALVIESIVQAVVEGARAIASAASYDFSGAALHAAAAAAWAGVGIVAGGVGAAIGGFGGGGKDAPSTSNSVTPTDASTSAQQSQPMVINVYPGGYITRRDVNAGIVDALNEAGRDGYRLDPGLVGG